MYVMANDTGMCPPNPTRNKKLDFWNPVWIFRLSQ